METGTFETTASFTGEDQTTEFETPDMGPANNEDDTEPWGGELLALVSANEEVMVRCPWMDDVEVTLGTAMTTYDYPPNLIAEDEAFLIMVVNELLANQVIKAEEPREESEAEEETVAHEKEEDPQENKRTQTKESDQEAEAKSLKVETDSKTTNEQRRPQQTTATTRKAETLSIKKDQPPQTVTVVITTTMEPVVGVQPVQVSHSKSDVFEREVTIKRKKVEAEGQAETLATIEPKSEAASVIESLVLAEPQIAINQRPEFPVQPASAEVSAEPEYATSLAVGIKSPTVLDEDTLAPTDETVEIIEDTPVLVASHYEIDTGDPENSGKEVIVGNNFEIPSPETVVYNSRIEDVIHIQTDDTSDSSEGIGVVDHEQPVEISATAEQAERLLVQLGERIKESDPQTAETTNEYFDKMIEVAIKLESPSGEKTIFEIEAAEELEELFTELFDLVEIPHTPELVEYLAHQTFARHLVDEIEKLKIEEAIDETPQADGMHVIIKKLIASLRTLQRSITHYCAVGRVALTLCSFNAPLALGRN